MIGLTGPAWVVASVVVLGGHLGYPVIDDLPGGRYSLVAGSDADNDLFICDAGEACGAWLTLDQPLEIDLDSDRSDINFPVDYLIAIPDLAASAQATGDKRPASPQARPTAASSK